MLPVAELLSVGREPLDRSIWASLQEKNKQKTKTQAKLCSSVTEASRFQIQTLIFSDKCHRLIRMHGADASK